MTATQATILAALIGSPLIYSAFENISNRLRALVGYKGWQAVFLDSGQVYFGKIKSINKSELDLVDIYYLKDKKTESGNLPSDMHLIKLGNEIHGPKDKMTISRSHIIFSEDLKNNSSVVKSINHHSGEAKAQGVDLANHKV